MRVTAEASSTGTRMVVPRKLEPCCDWTVVKALSGRASTKPSPAVLRLVRKVATLSVPRARTWIEGSMAREKINEPPGWGVKVLPFSVPVRSSVIWLMAPLTGF